MEATTSKKSFLRRSGLSKGDMKICGVKASEHLSKSFLLLGSLASLSYTIMTSRLVNSGMAVFARSDNVDVDVAERDRFIFKMSKKRWSQKRIIKKVKVKFGGKPLTTNVKSPLAAYSANR